MAEHDEILAEVRASPMRRGVGLLVIWCLGALLLWLVLTRSPANAGFQLLLIAIGLGALWVGEMLRRATTQAIELTQEGLRTSDGEVIVPWDQIASVDRGAFAFKPSNGFILRLVSRAPLRWRPGLWWRWGRRVGVGGVTPGTQTKAMADIIGLRLQSDRAARQDSL